MSTTCEERTENLMRKSKKILAVMLTVAMVLVMIPMQTFGATKAYYLGLSGSGQKYSVKIGGKYFYQTYDKATNNSKLWCATLKGKKGKQIGSYSQREVLTDGRKVFYVKYYNSRPVICSVNTTGTSKISYTKTRGEEMAQIIMLSVYKGRLYYAVGDSKEGTGNYKLKSLSVTTKGVKTHKQSFIPYQKLEWGNTAKTVKSSRYIQGYTTVSEKTIRVYDCFKPDRNITFNGTIRGFAGSKLVYTTLDEETGELNIYSRGTYGTGAAKLLATENDSWGSFSIAKIASDYIVYKVYVGEWSDGSDKYYKYTLSTSEKTEITSDEFYRF